MPNQEYKIAVCVCTTYNSNYPQFLIDKINEDLKDDDNVDIFVLTDRNDVHGDNIFNFSWDELRATYRLNHYNKNHKPKDYIGNVLFSFLRFYNAYPEYNKYVFVEDDLLWTGNWKELFESIYIYTTDIDVVLPQLLPESKIKWWFWTKKCKYYVNNLKKYGGMLQLYALSGKAIKFLDDELKKKVCFGHFELLANTLLINNQDLTKFYFKKTIPINDIYVDFIELKRHLINKKFQPNHLYHPIKSLNFYKEHI